MGDAAGECMLQQGSITLFRVRGVPIRAHWTLLLIVPYLAYALSLNFKSIATTADVAPQQLLLPAAVWGLILTVGLFVSITLHELAHAYVATRAGGRVESIELMLVGGVSHVVRAPQRPSDEAHMAIVGPLTSLLVGGLFLVGYMQLGSAPADVRMGLFYVAAANLTLGAFNLLPAFPMDGGRLLRALLATRLGPRRATRIAATVGKVCAVGLVGLGVWNGNPLMILIAVFVYNGARSEVIHERVHRALHGLRVGDLLPMIQPLPVIDADEPLVALLPRMHDLDRLELVVIDAQGSPIGVVLARDLLGIPTHDRARMSVGDLVNRVPKRHATVASTATANEALEIAAESNAELIIVIDPSASRREQLLGLVASRDITRMVRLQLAAKRPADHARPASRGAIHA